MKRDYQRFFVLLIGLLSVSLTYANEQFIKEIEETRAIYLKSVDGNKRDVRRAIQHIKKLARKYPKHPLVIVYKGASLSQRGGGAGGRPLNRMRDTEEGLGYIDRGLRLLKKHQLHYLEITEAQLLAAFVFINIPDTIFHRLKEGNHLVKKMLAHPKFGEMPSSLQAGIFFAAATVAEKFNDAEKQKEYLELSLEADADGESSKGVKAMLKSLAD